MNRLNYKTLAWMNVEQRIPLLSKEGWTRHQEKDPKAPYQRRGRGGCFKQPFVDYGQPPRLRPAKVASRHFLNGRSHPPSKGEESGLPLSNKLPATY